MDDYGNGIIIKDNRLYFFHFFLLFHFFHFFSYLELRVNVSMTSQTVIQCNTNITYQSQATVT